MSFLATPAQTREGLEATGFTVSSLRETTEQALAYGARSRAMVERGEKPPHRAVQLIHGELAQECHGERRPRPRGIAHRPDRDPLHETSLKQGEFARAARFPHDAPYA